MRISLIVFLLVYSGHDGATNRLSDVNKAILVPFFYQMLSPNFTHITNSSGESVSLYFIPILFPAPSEAYLAAPRPRG